MNVVYYVLRFTSPRGSVRPLSCAAGLPWLYRQRKKGGSNAFVSSSFLYSIHFSFLLSVAISIPPSLPWKANGQQCGFCICLKWIFKKANSSSLFSYRSPLWSRILLFFYFPWSWIHIFLFLLHRCFSVWFLALLFVRDCCSVLRV